MAQIEASKLADFVTLPLANAGAVLAVTTSPAVIDLATIGNQAIDLGSQQKSTIGLAGHYVSFQADGGSVYIVAGPTAASVSTGNAPNPAGTGTNVAGLCFLIPAGGVFSAIPRTAVDQFVGYVTATGTATLRIFLSSF